MRSRNLYEIWNICYVPIYLCLYCKEIMSILPERESLKNMKVAFIKSRFLYVSGSPPLETGLIRHLSYQVDCQSVPHYIQPEPIKEKKQRPRVKVKWRLTFAWHTIAAAVSLKPERALFSAKLDDVCT